MGSQAGVFDCGIPIGRSLANATFVEANVWAVVNAVGNAQAWAITHSARVMARDGAFQDRLPACSTDGDRSDDGGADGLTGFRLIRELG